MPIIVTVPPVGIALTTLARMKLELGIADASADDLLTELIDEASSAISRECGWPFGLATYVETIKGSNSQYLGLSRVPIVTVLEVLEDGLPLVPVPPTAWVDPAQDNYWVDDVNAGSLYRPIGWGRTSGLKMWGWESAQSGYILPGGNALLRYQITYRAGYILPGIADPYIPLDPTYPADPQPLPGALQRSCLEAVKDWYFAAARDPALTQKTVSGVEIAYRAKLLPSRSLPDSALGLLRNYKRVF